MMPHLGLVHRHRIQCESLSSILVLKLSNRLFSSHRRSWVPFRTSTNACLQACGSKRFGCHADLYTVSRCYTRDESEDHTDEKACKKGSTLLLKPRTNTNRSQKIRLSVAPQKGLMSSKNLKKTNTNTFDPEVIRHVHVNTCPDFLCTNALTREL